MTISIVLRQETGFAGHSIGVDGKLVHPSPVSDASEAHRRLEVGYTTGKLV